MFSATFSGEIKKLANQILNKPVLIEVAKSNSINDLITHVVYETQSDHKSELLLTFMKVRLNLLEKDLDFRFEVSVQHVSAILSTYIFFGT